MMLSVQWRDSRSKGNRPRLVRSCVVRSCVRASEPTHHKSGPPWSAYPETQSQSNTQPVIIRNPPHHLDRNNTAATRLADAMSTSITTSRAFDTGVAPQQLLTPSVQKPAWRKIWGNLKIGHVLIPRLARIALSTVKQPGGSLPRVMSTVPAPLTLHTAPHQCWRNN